MLSSILFFLVEDSPSKTMIWSIVPPSNTNHKEDCMFCQGILLNLHFTLLVGSEDMTSDDSFCEVFNLDIFSGKCS